MKEVFGAVLSIKDNVSGVMQQAKASTKGYRGEVEKAKKDLEKLDKQKVKEKELKLKNSSAYKAIEGVKKKIEPLTKKVINVQAKTENAVDKIKKVRSHLDKIKTSKVVQLTVKGTGAAAKALGKAAIVGTAAAFTAVSVAAGAAVTQAAAYQSQMQNVGTLLDGDVKGKLQSMSKDLKQVSLDTGVVTSDLTDGLYQVVSAFGESSESVKQLEIAAKAAKAGNATTTDSVNMLSAVTKGYGDTSAAAMQKASDLAFLTVKLGQTSFPELAASMGQVVPLAATMKVSQEELFGAMSTLTGVTGGTAEVTTQLRATMQEFLSPSSQMEKMLTKMGYASGATALESEGLGGILNKLKEQVGDDEIAFANLFSSIESKNAVLALTGAQAENFASKTAAMGEAAGATERAFATQTNSVSAMAGRLKNAGSVMLTSLGEQALPYIQTALEGVIDKIPAFTQVLGSMVNRAGPMFGQIVNAVSGMVAQWQPVASQAGGMFATAFSQAAPYIESFKTNFGSILTAVQPTVLTLASVISSAIPPLAGIFSGLSGVVAAVMPVISTIVSDVGGMISRVFGKAANQTGILQQIFSVAGPAISEVLSTVWSIVGPILGLLVDQIGVVVDTFSWAFPHIQSVIETVWGVIGPIFDAIGKGIGVVVSALKKIKGGGTGDGGTGDSGGGMDAHATGTPYYSGGWTTVGEHGPELMRLPSGSKILSNQASSNITARGDRPISIHIDKMEVRNNDDIDAVAEKLAKKIEEAEENM